MSKKLPINNFKWKTDLSIFTEDFIKNYDENSDIGYLFYADITYPKELYKSDSDLPFLSDRMKVNKVNKLVNYFYDKNNYAIHILTLKKAIAPGLILKEVHKVISFRHDAWLKPYIETSTELRAQAKNNFKKGYFKLKINSALGKTMQNIRKHRDIELVTTE